jgi:hypothetical protein
MFLPSSEPGDLPGLPCGGGNDSTAYSFGQPDSPASITLWNGFYRYSSTLVARGFTNFINVASRLSRDEQVATQLTTCILSGCSLVCSVIALYWFWRMKRLFRHKYEVSIAFGLTLALTFGQADNDSHLRRCLPIILVLHLYSRCPRWEQS